MSIRVLHIAALSSAVRNIGVIRQMQSERDAARDLGFDWNVEVWAADNLSEFDFIRTYPVDCAGRVARRGHFNRTLVAHGESHDVILLRYVPVDPFLSFRRPLAARMALVFHTKDSPALRSQFRFPGGVLLAMADWVSAQFVLRNVDGLVAVTEDILDYHIRRARLGDVPRIVIPNGIDLGRFGLADDKRGGKIKLLFTASSFFSWHGLRNLLQSLSAFRDREAVEVHLVGDVSDSDRDFIQDEGLQRCVVLHGRLNIRDLRRCLEVSDIGIASFGLGESGLTEACTLKVREYLAAGVPVYSGHRDVAFAEGFAYYRIGPPSIAEILGFAAEMRQVGRPTVRSAAESFIDKTRLVSRLHDWALELCADSKRV